MSAYNVSAIDYNRVPSFCVAGEMLSQSWVVVDRVFCQSGMFLCIKRYV